jgi:ABC-type dipeptide/oligopeptide/nickel transport system permease subunit
VISDAPLPERNRALRVIARVVSWPLSVLAVALGSLWLLVVLAARAVRWGAHPDKGIKVGGKRWADHLTQGGRYLAFRTDEFPRLDGTLRKPGESPGPWQEARRRLGRSKIALLAWIGLALYLIVGILSQAGAIGGDFAVSDKSAPFIAPWWAPEPPEQPTRSPKGDTWFAGTDYIGHGVWAMVLRGTAVALWIGTFAAVLACVIGSVLGAVAGYFGGWVDEVIVWLYTTLESIPEMLLILAFAFAFKNNEGIRDAYNGSFLASWGLSLGLFSIILVIGLTFWTGVCRQVRGEFIRQRDLDYVTAARALGIPTRRIVFRHVFPNVFHLVLISFSLLFIGAIKYEVVLTFLGVGVEPGEASWGQMISGAKLELLREPSVWWQISAATAMLFGLVLCVNLFTDALRDALDPRTRT